VPTRSRALALTACVAEKTFFFGLDIGVAPMMRLRRREQKQQQKLWRKGRNVGAKVAEELVASEE
jgi:hypothetical protein